MLTVYGIKNCSSVKKALAYLDERSVDYQFVDFKKQPATKEQIERWLQHVDWQLLLNMRGTTWRKLSDNTRATINKNNAIQLMLDNASIIKRPVIETRDTVIVGFQPEVYAQL